MEKRYGEGYYHCFITLGVKDTERKNYNEETLQKKTLKLFNDVGYVSLIFSIENYSTTGYHVHAYYRGRPIYWKNFNKLWGIGYVKDQTVYDVQGLIKYIKKHGTYWDYGLPLDDTEKSVIERFVGHSLEDEIQKVNFFKEDEILPVDLISSSSEEQPDYVDKVFKEHGLL